MTKKMKMSSYYMRIFFNCLKSAARNYRELSAQPVAVPDNFLQRSAPNKKKFSQDDVFPLGREKNASFSIEFSQ